MERIVVTHSNGTTLPLYGRTNVVKIASGQQKKKLLGENIVEMTLKSSRALELQIGDKITVFGEDYFINILPEAKKISTRDYEYTITFEGVQYDLAKVVFLDEDASGLSTSSTFSLRANIEQIGAIIINNLNRVYGAGKWVLYETPSQTTDVRDFSYNEDNCLSVLQRACEEYGTEFKIAKYVSGANTVYRLSIKRIGSVLPYTFQYGKNRGLYSIKRKTIDSSNLVTRLYAYGGTTNIPTNYRNYSTRLRFSNDAYIEDNDAIAAFGLIEGAKLFDDIFPKYAGTVTGINAEDILSFTDTSMFDLNAKDAENNDLYKIPDVSPKIIFNSGELAGYTFEITEYDHSTHTFKILSYEDERGQKFPSVETSTFRIGSGDKYILTDIYPPQSFIDTAEAELQAKATEYLNANKAPRVQYEVDIAESYLDNIHAGDSISNFFEVGDSVGIEDTEIGISRTGGTSIRITEFARDLTSRTHYNYNLSLSDTVEVDIIERIISSQNELETIVVINDLTDVSRLRRSWRTTQELLTMTYDQDGYFDSGKIRPLSVETSMLSVGAKSQQFTLQNTRFEPNYNGNHSVIKVIGGSLTHYTIEDTIKNWELADNTTTGLITNTAYYIYARCNRSNTSGNILFDTVQRTVDSDPLYYYFLIGTLSSVITDDGGKNPARLISLTYGASTINGRFIRTGRIQSSGGGTTYFDLDAGEIGGNIKFVASDGSTKNVSDLDSVAQETKDYINNTLPGILSDIQAQLDGQIESWFQTSDPSTAWTNAALKAAHTGDMWYSSSTKLLKRYTGSAWTTIEDQKAIDAYTAASKAQDTADGKRRVFVAQPYPPYDIGDLWLKDWTDNGVNKQELYRSITARATGSYIANDWAVAVYYDNTKTTIDGGIVTSGTVQLAGSDASIKAGITGEGTSDTSVRIWAGASKENKTSAPFRVLQDGTVYAQKANITGEVNATSGSFTGTVNAQDGIFHGSIATPPIAIADNSTQLNLSFDSGFNFAGSLVSTSYKTIKLPTDVKYSGVECSIINYGTQSNGYYNVQVYNGSNFLYSGTSKNVNSFATIKLYGCSQLVMKAILINSTALRWFVVNPNEFSYDYVNSCLTNNLPNQIARCIGAYNMTTADLMQTLSCSDGNTITMSKRGSGRWTFTFAKQRPATKEYSIVLNGNTNIYIPIIHDKSKSSFQIDLNLNLGTNNWGNIGGWGFIIFEYDI